jgi:hypothetical protein
MSGGYGSSRTVTQCLRLRALEQGCAQSLTVGSVIIPGLRALPTLLHKSRSLVGFDQRSDFSAQMLTPLVVEDYLLFIQ